MATIMRAEEGSLFAPPPHAQSHAPEQRAEAADDEDYFSFDSGDEADHAGPELTPPGSPRAQPPSARFTKDMDVLVGLADLEISPSYPPYAFDSPGEGALVRSQGRHKKQNNGAASSSSSMDGGRQLHF